MIVNTETQKKTYELKAGRETHPFESQDKWTCNSMECILQDQKQAESCNL